MGVVHCSRHCVFYHLPVYFMLQFIRRSRGELRSFICPLFLCAFFCSVPPPHIYLLSFVISSYQRFAFFCAAHHAIFTAILLERHLIFPFSFSPHSLSSSFYPISIFSVFWRKMLLLFSTY